MSVGPAEFLLLVLVGMVALMAAKCMRRRWPWVAVAACFVVAIVVTPADPVSTLLVAVPCALPVVLWALWNLNNGRPSNVADR